MLTQLLLVQRLPDRRGTGVAVRVDQAGQEEPTVVHGFRSGNMLQAEPVVDDVDVAFLVLGKDNAP